MHTSHTVSPMCNAGSAAYMIHEVSTVVHAVLEMLQAGVSAANMMEHGVLEMRTGSHMMRDVSKTMQDESMRWAGSSATCMMHEVSRPGRLFALSKSLSNKEHLSA
mgnify:CR=1 FL=1